MRVSLSSDFFIGNRERLCQLFTGTAPIVLTANGLLQRASDEAYPFDQDSSFWYLTGIEHPDIILVIDKGKEYLIVPGREASREAFDGAVSYDELTERSGIKEIYNEKEGWRLLGARLKKVQHVATLAANPKYIDSWGLYANPARGELIRRMKGAHASLELLDLRQHLARMRMVKQPIELELMQEAIDITIDALKDVTRAATLTKYEYEYELEADITRGFRKRGAQGHAFEPIVASGKRACTLHNIANEGLLSSDELVVMDVGARVSHYAADITRTVSLSGQPSRRQEQIYEAVCEAQDYAYSLLKPGVLMREFEKQMEQFVGEKLRELGLIKSISKETVRAFFPHATSHFLGLDTHDSGDYDHPLEPNMVLTVEPGIYVPEEGIGIRIEDDILITSDGNINLSKRLPRVLA